MKESETDRTTPEHLVKMLDAQTAMRRAERTQSSRNRVMLLVGGVLFIVVGAGVALMVLLQMLSDLQQRERRSTAQTAVLAAHEKF